MQQTHCQNVLRAYREVLHLIKRLPKAQRGPALEQVLSPTQLHPLLSVRASLSS